MAHFGWHKRNHSFPPSPRYVQKPSKILGPPLPDIDDEPWMHFLSTPDEEEDYADYLHFNAGILAGGEAQKHMIQKFKSHRSTDNIRHHHGSFTRRTEHHGWVQGGSLPHAYTTSPSGQVKGIDIQPLPGSQPRRRSRRTLSGHRHSWQEPSMDLFTLDEEIPQIIVSDYDAAKDDQQRSDSLVESTSTVEGNTKQADRTSDSEEVAQSPRLNASLPVDMPDVELNQMWFAERARL